MKKAVILLSALILGFSHAGQAHKRWLLPTDFALSGAETVTVDFTASNNIFYVDNPMPLVGVRALSPSGEEMVISDRLEGARRSSFNLDISEEGTHRVVVQGEPVYFLSYSLPGAEKPQFERGPLEVLQTRVPKGAREVKYARSTALIETYITLNAPTAPPSIGKPGGISLQPVSHPSELYSDEPGEFLLMLDGAPAAGLALIAVPEGTRYRDSQAQARFVSGEGGRVAVQWQGPGRYLLEAALEVPAADGEIAVYYYNYFLSVEVLAP